MLYDNELRQVFIVVLSTIFILGIAVGCLISKNVSGFFTGVAIVLFVLFINAITED